MATTCRVYTIYRQDEPPAHPGLGWTRFVCISDTHSHVFPIPPGDILIHAGDLSSWGTHKQVLRVVDWLKDLPHELKIIVAGNHDASTLGYFPYSLHTDYRRQLSLDTAIEHKNPAFLKVLNPQITDNLRDIVRSAGMREVGIYYLEREQMEVTGANGARWKFYGSPAAPHYASGAFQYHTRAEAEDEWSKIPDDVEVLITHTPPYGVLDVTKRGKHAGCDELVKRTARLGRCRLHVFGHIHEAHGAQITSRSSEAGDIVTVSVNAALAHSGQAVIVDLVNHPEGTPIVSK